MILDARISRTFLEQLAYEDCHYLQKNECQIEKLRVPTMIIKSKETKETILIKTPTTIYKTASRRFP